MSVKLKQLGVIEIQTIEFLRRYIVKIMRKLKRKIYLTIVEPIVSKMLFFLHVDKRKIVFSNFSGKGYGDNPKYIAEQIIKNQLDFKLVWLVNEISDDFPDEIRQVKNMSIPALVELSTAKIWIDNVRNYHPIHKKKSQFYLQTWHGSYGPKKIEKEVERTLPKSYVKQARLDGKMLDAIISGNNLQTKQFLDYFWLSDKAEILEIGLPRNDIFFDLEFMQKTRKKLQQLYAIEEDELVVLYMPTFRDDGSTKGYDIDYHGIIQAFRERYKKKVKIIVRFHPNVQSIVKIPVSSDIINVTEYPDSQELMFLADIMISDFSSAPFDFTLLNKIVFLLLLDYEDYIKQRGITSSFEQIPFLKAYSNQELIDDIRQFDEKENWKRLENFYEIYKCYDKGNASEKAVEWIKNKIID